LFISNERISHASAAMAVVEVRIMQSFIGMERMSHASVVVAQGVKYQNGFGKVLGH
jgi:hypothetical protein